MERLAEFEKTQGQASCSRCQDNYVDLKQENK
jgi:hypothetical protein